LFLTRQENPKEF